MQREQAALTRGELSRQEQFRQLQLEAPVTELPEQGLLLGAPMQVAEPEFPRAGRIAGQKSSSGQAGESTRRICIKLHRLPRVPNTSIPVDMSGQAGMVAPSMSRSTQ